jgi:hypothetical protein
MRFIGFMRFMGGFRGSGFRVQGSGFKVQGSRFTVRVQRLAPARMCVRSLWRRPRLNVQNLEPNGEPNLEP